MLVHEVIPEEPRGRPRDIISVPVSHLSPSPCPTISVPVSHLCFFDLGINYSFILADINDKQ